MRLEHRQVQRSRHPVIQEAEVRHRAVVVHEVLFVERPADALSGATLHLVLNVSRVDRLASILEHAVAHHIGLARIGIDIEVANVQSERIPRGRQVRRRRCRNRTTSVAQPRSQVLETKVQFRIRLAAEDTVRELNVVLVDAPERRRPHLHLIDHLRRGFPSCKASSVGHSATTSRPGVTNLIRVRNARVNIVSIEAQDLSSLHRDRCTRPADILRTLVHRNRAVILQHQVNSRLPAAIHPETNADAATTFPARRRFAQGRVPVVRISRLLQHLDQADAIEHHTIAVSRAFLRRVVEPELHLVPAHRVADLVHDSLDRETYLRRTGSPVRR